MYQNQPSKNLILAITLIFNLFLAGCNSINDRLRGKNHSGDASNIEPSSTELKPYHTVERSFPLSKTVSACDNFYDHVCSDEAATFQLPSTKSSHIFYIDEITDQLEKAQTSYLEGLMKKSENSLPALEIKLKKLFGACMASGSQHAEEEKKYHLEILAKVDALTTKEQVLDALSDGMVEGHASKIEFGAAPNLDRPSINDVVFSPILILDDQSYLENPELLSAYRDLNIMFFRSLGVAKPEESADAVQSYETQLGKINPDPGQWYDRYNRKQYHSRDDFINKFINLRLSKILPKLPNDTLIRDIAGDMLEKVDEIFSTMNREQLAALYLHQALKDSMRFSAPEYFSQLLKFRSTYLGAPAQAKEGLERCVDYMNRSYSQELSYLTLPMLFPQVDMVPVENMVKEIVATVRDRLKENTWLSEGARNKAILKLDRLNYLIGMPTTIPTWNFSPNFEISDVSEVINNVRLSDASTAQIFKDIANPNDPKKWFMNPLDVNAYYSPDTNSFVLPLGQVVAPNFDASWPKFRNLGAAGYVIGHEIGHAFDTSGSLYDETGKLDPWMTEEDNAIFSDRTKIFNQQFDDAGIHGDQTETENLADLFGLRVTYDAAFKKEGGTNEQKKAFFYEFAKQWCGVSTSEYRERIVESDVHAPADARVNQTVRQIPEFQEVFGCPSDSPMTLPSEKRVSIW